MSLLNTPRFSKRCYQLMIMSAAFLPLSSMANIASPQRTPKNMTSAYMALTRIVPIEKSSTDIAASGITPVDIENFSQSSTWRKLLYFKKKKPLWGDKSEVDDDTFFLSPKGRHNPHAELVDMLHAMYDTPSKGDAHVLCRYPARTHAITQAFKINTHALPRPVCKKYDDWKKVHHADAVTLVFPSAFLNSPASMFGHLFLRLNQKKYANNPMLMPAANFAAITPPDFSPPSYIYNGLLGGYPGRYSVTPYYAKLKEYVDQENRAIWEYPLSLTPEQLAQFNRHLWEVSPFYYDYFFMDENCAYRIISLIEAVVPQVNITSKYPLRALPTDMIHELRASQIAGKPTYRPSGMDNFLAHFHSLSPDNKKHVSRLKHADPKTINATVRKLNKENAAAILEVVHEYNQILAHTQERDKARNKRLIGVLRARAKIKQVKPLPDATQPDTSPDQAHAPIAMGVALGQLNEKAYLSLQLRSLNHAKHDPLTGYLPGNELLFLDTAVRAYTDSGSENSLQVERFNLVKLSTIRPISQFFQPLSWQGKLGGERCPTEQQKWKNRFDAGLGYSFGTTDPAQAWQHMIAGFGMVQVRDTSCLTGEVNKYSKHLDVYPKLQWLTQHKRVSMSYDLSLEEQGALLTHHAGLFWNPQYVPMNIGVEYRASDMHDEYTDQVQLKLNLYSK